jgi:hypothetical protein
VTGGGFPTHWLDERLEEGAPAVPEAAPAVFPPPPAPALAEVSVQLKLPTPRASIKPTEISFQ